ncbi:MAG: hypothetical protein QUV07_05430 [Cyanobium sp. CZS 25K]|nr:hypothetical protein [Cyanobium sp. CZS25K]
MAGTGAVAVGLAAAGRITVSAARAARVPSTLSMGPVQPRQR